ALVGHREVGLLDAREDLFVEALLEPFGPRHERVRIGVLGFQVLAHLQARLVAQPVVVVAHLLPVELDGARHLARGRAAPGSVGGGLGGAAAAEPGIGARTAAATRQAAMRIAGAYTTATASTVAPR